MRPQDRLCVDKCFEMLISKDLGEIGSIILPEDWQDRLTSYMAEKLELTFLDRGTFCANFKKHLAAYEQSPDVNETSRKTEIICRKLFSSDNPSEGRAIVRQLSKGVGNCQQGFENVVNSLVTSFTLPDSLDALLTSMRQGIVQSAARKLTVGTHAINQFSVIASAMGYGVEPLNTHDIYTDEYEEEEVREKLSKAFSERYSLQTILLETTETIAAIMHDKLLYRGRLAVQPGDISYGYSCGEYENFLNYLAKIFPETNISRSQFLILDECSEVVDLNWREIRRTLLRTLINQGYFNLLAEETTVLGWLLDGGYSQGAAAGSSTESSSLACLFENDLVYSTEVLSFLLSTIEPEDEAILTELIDRHLQRQDPGIMKIMVIAEIFESFKYNEAYHPFLRQYIRQSSELLAGLLIKKISIEDQSYLAHCLKLKEYESAPLVLDPEEKPYNVLMIIGQFYPSLASKVLTVMKHFSPEQKVSVLKQRFLNDQNIFMLVANCQPEILLSLSACLSDLEPSQKLKILLQSDSRGQSTFTLLSSKLEIIEFLAEDAEKNLVRSMAYLAQKVRWFKTRSDKDLPESPYAISRFLRKSLESSFLEYLDSNKEASKRDVLTHTWRLSIFNARPVLSTHRNMQDTLVKVAVSLTIIGLFYLQCRPGGFSQNLTNTESARILDELEAGVLKLGEQEQGGSFISLNY